ncbi:hypothetical protein M0L20_29910 [Spirosoma sp. RP8]|uniref:DNA-binding protein n=1 Tax=Spirosoma liriopis TaxID=2937440 RepID=A0ABT0HVW8_9BACT|nr:hypothetical protein [Spirosoma liriopis]MCK8496120.1 hypothetical protein [Spirosoma liriopis]
MNYLTLKEASEATGLNETTIRRLCKKKASKPFIQMKKGKQGDMYTIQANYLFDVYPPSKPIQNSARARVDNNYTSIDKEPIQDYTALLAAKDEIIQLLRSETNYLRSENTSLREENRTLKLLPAPISTSDTTPTETSSSQESKKPFWKRLFG